MPLRYTKARCLVSETMIANGPAGDRSGCHSNGLLLLALLACLAARASASVTRWGATLSRLAPVSKIRNADRRVRQFEKPLVVALSAIDQPVRPKGAAPPVSCEHRELVGSPQAHCAQFACSDHGEKRVSARAKLITNLARNAGWA